ncbi:ferredoxin--NADP reductase [Chryseobacterium wangxinyae]|uniref:ferredoxin--NADP reductase n=1 Tax=Chryseobacterium sp. CY350 TaxID=2997336 RepID=UPI0022710801|nr:ferredoxin--NADP reductase [Chryseobacterium sp. CY350]MCY0977118.1 ferredoxin--NADP reductase [Chryseobacterium sp. CY350]WBZ97114.1 ferredoxin--NADP reductase [Chryseobacterium sp. CY350]
MQKFYSLVVKEISKKTSKAYSLLFDIPSELRESFAFKAGQYITIKCNIDGEEIRRCYSISSISNEAETFQVVVKSVPNGIFSKYVEENVKAGDILEVSEPEGNFCYEPTNEKSKTIVAVAAGSGITPIFSIIQSILSFSNDQIILFYGNKSEEQTIFNKEIIKLEGDFNDRFKVIKFYTQEKIEGSHFGRINQKIILETLQNHDFSTIEKFYVCGPEDLIKNTTNTFLSQNIKKENILFELFFSPQTCEQNKAVVSENSGETIVKLILDGEEETISVDKNTLLLDSILDAGFDIPYSCQNAICSTCLCVLTKGEVNMVKNEVLSDAEIDEGKIVVCQSYPVSDKIEINYDII